MTEKKGKGRTNVALRRVKIVWVTPTLTRGMFSILEGLGKNYDD